MRYAILLAAGLAALPLGPAAAESAPPVAVELFTSQGCYSCPPAEAYLGELAGRADVIALEWHVDYWDDLVYGGAGKWRDPFSLAAATARQRAYNAAITGAPRAYTPQMIVAGAAGMVGSDRGEVESAIRKARKAAPAASLAVEPHGDGQIVVSATGAATTLWRVDFVKTHVTEVLRGENKGKRLVSHHIVRAKTRLGATSGKPIATTAPGEGLGCAILAQVGETGPVLAASYCPGSGPARPPA